MSGPLRTALVSGASRGVGKGIAVSLAKDGFRVYATRRSIEAAELPDSIVRIRCDHTHDDETAGVFARIVAEAGGLDLLVNSAWGGYERMTEDGVFTWTLPFWEQPNHRWASMINAGLRTAFVNSCFAAKMMVPRHRGLIVNLSYWAARKHIGNVIYGVAKAATDKMTSDMAEELRPHGVTALCLYPGLVRTEAVTVAAQAGWLDLANSESPELTGRVIAGLVRDSRLTERSGKVFVVASLAAEFGLFDTDGRQPWPLTLETA